METIKEIIWSLFTPNPLSPYVIDSFNGSVYNDHRQTDLPLHQVDPILMHGQRKVSGSDSREDEIEYSQDYEDSFDGLGGSIADQPFNPNRESSDMYFYILQDKAQSCNISNEEVSLLSDDFHRMMNSIQWIVFNYKDSDEEDHEEKEEVRQVEDGGINNQSLLVNDTNKNNNNNNNNKRVGPEIIQVHLGEERITMDDVGSNTTTPYSVPYIMKVSFNDKVVWLEKYILCFLGHCYRDKDDVRTLNDNYYEAQMSKYPVLFPRQLYGNYFTPRHHESHQFDILNICRPITEDTFMVDSQLDYVFSDIMDTILFSYLHAKIALLTTGYDEPIRSMCPPLALKLEIIETNRHLYRELKRKRYHSCNDVHSHVTGKKGSHTHYHFPVNDDYDYDSGDRHGQNHDLTCPYCWRIYTKTTSLFFRNVMSIINSPPLYVPPSSIHHNPNPSQSPSTTTTSTTNTTTTTTTENDTTSVSYTQHHLKFDYSSLDIEYIPFQLVVLLTNVSEHRELFAQYTKEKISTEWVSVPVLFYKIWQLTLINPI